MEFAQASGGARVKRSIAVYHRESVALAREGQELSAATVRKLDSLKGTSAPPKPKLNENEAHHDDHTANRGKARVGC
jgi:hypothetical protein